MLSYSSLTGAHPNLPSHLQVPVSYGIDAEASAADRQPSFVFRVPAIFKNTLKTTAGTHRRSAYESSSQHVDEWPRNHVPQDAQET